MPIHSAAQLIAVIQAQSQPLQGTARDANALCSIACAAIAAVVESGNQTSSRLLRVVASHPFEAATAEARFLRCVAAAKLLALAAPGAWLTTAGGVLELAPKASQMQVDCYSAHVIFAHSESQHAVALHSVLSGIWSFKTQLQG